MQINQGGLMSKLMIGLLMGHLFFSSPSEACTKNGSEGFLPKNDLNISVDAKEISSVTESEFNDVISDIEKIYAPIVSGYGGELVVVRKWNDGTVNAYAERSGKFWKVSMFGGLARHRTITADGFALVVCHEIGHHIGGVPHYSYQWASNEGQSDYFATLKCLRRVWQSEDNISVVEKMEVPEFLTKSCRKEWRSREDRALCIRGAMAGESVTKLFSSLSWNPKPAKFDTPDPKEVIYTNDNHPATQCRLDTYFQGALCEASFNEEIGQEEETQGVCHSSRGHTVGVRPRCWFKPTL